MHVFVTGGTGTIGTAVVAELLAHSHTVLGLARSTRSAATLTAAGAQVLRGDLSDPDALRRGAAATDGTITLAFGRDSVDPRALARAVDEEVAAQTVLAGELDGTGRPLVVASGTPWVAGRVATERDPLAADGPVGKRAAAVTELLARGGPGLRSSVVRIPRTAHERGAGGFAGVLTDLARRSGVAGYPGDGTQRWPAVHARDAAAVFRLALERAPAGTTWHAVAEQGVAVRDIADVVGRRLGLAVRAVPAATFGPLGPVFATDCPASSTHTRAELGWTPTHPGLLADLEHVSPDGSAPDRHGRRHQGSGAATDDSATDNNRSRARASTSSSPSRSGA